MTWQLVETLTKLCAATCKASGALSALSALFALAALATLTVLATLAVPATLFALVASALESALETALTVAFSAVVAVIQTHLLLLASLLILVAWCWWAPLSRSRPIHLPALPKRKPPLALNMLLVQVSVRLTGGQMPTQALAEAGAPSQLNQAGESLYLHSLIAAKTPWWLGQSRRQQAGVNALAARSALAGQRLAQRLGSPLAQVLGQVAGMITQATRGAQQRYAALAAPVATARMLAALPLVGVALGALLGVRVWQFWLDGALGSITALGGLGFLCVGRLVTSRMVGRAQEEVNQFDDALLLDLCGAALHSGASIPRCLEALGFACEIKDFGFVARALEIGASWDEAWSLAAPNRAGYKALSQCLAPAWLVGANPLPMLEAWAQTLRDQRESQASADANRLAVRLVLPLGLCHLPAFILLAIVPAVVYLGRSVLAGA